MNTLVLAEDGVFPTYTTLVIHLRAGLPFYCGIEVAQQAPIVISKLHCIEPTPF